MRVLYFFIAFLTLNWFSIHREVKAQSQLSESNLLKLNKLQDTLHVLSNSSTQADSDVEKIAHNSTFVKKLIQALKTPYSFQHNLEAVTNISILTPQSNPTFRIISWFIPFSYGTYKYYGAIQMATKDGSLKLFPLNDDTENLENDNQISTPKNWYGARYYDLITVNNPGKSPIHLLLGWKGNNLKTTKKIIEVLSFEKEEPIFGKNNFFATKEESLNRNRIVFEYSKRNSMTLMYDKNLNMIIFDHLAPFEPNMIGNFEYYASDLTFDGYAIGYQKLYLKENIPMKNEASSLDEQYATPRKATTLLRKMKN